MTSLRRAWLFGTLTVGTLDGLDAVIFFGLRGATPLRIFQSIASGLLGKAAFDGGLGTALLGALLHYTVAGCIVATCFLISSQLPWLRARPLIWGPLFGVVAYLVMTQVVVPLSAASSGAKPMAVVVNGLVIHMLGVGLPSAFFARQGLADRG